MNYIVSNVFWLTLGVIVGIVAGQAIYWWPLGQLMNEWKAIWSLRHRYEEGDDVVVSPGTDLKPLNPQLQQRTITSDLKMKIWNDEGVGWHHTRSGWKRAHILHVFDPTQNGLPDVYRICHLDITSKSAETRS